MNIKTFVFIDLETTGLRYYKYAAKITEMCLVAVNRCHLTSNTSNKIPRILNKLNLCFYPNKTIPPTVSDLTGLCNDSLENIRPFSILSYELIDNFLKHQESPVCLVAHNGFNFDYLVLNDEIDHLQTRLSDNVMCIDSLSAFKEIITSKLSTNLRQPNIINNDLELEICNSFETDLLQTVELMEEQINISSNQNIEHAIKEQQLLNETTPKKVQTKPNDCKLKNKKVSRINGSDMVDASIRPKAKMQLNFDRERPKSFKLCDIYNFIFKNDMPRAHQAEYDVYALMQCCSSYHEQFLEYADNNCKSLNEFRSK